MVPTPDDAARAAQWLKNNHGGRASFLVAGLHGGSEKSTVATFTCTPRRSSTGARRNVTMCRWESTSLRICDILSAPRELLIVLERDVAGRMNARLVANLDDAMAKSLATGEMFVTLNGDWVASGQFVSAGDARALEEGAGLLTFKRELRELEARAEI